MTAHDSDGGKQSEAQALLEEASQAQLDGAFREALALCEEALARCEGDRERAEIAAKRGEIFLEMGELDEAHEALERAVALFRDAVPGSTWADLGAVFERKHDFEASAAAHEKSLALFEAELGPNHPSVCQAMASFAASLMKLGRHREADSILQDAITRFENERAQHVGIEPQFEGILLRQRADALDALGRADEAHALRVKAGEFGR